MKVAEVSDLEPDTALPVTVGDKEVALVHTQNEYFALDGICTHAHCSLSDGDIEDGNVVCPCHGGTFDPKTGEVVFPPPPVGVPVYPVRVEGDDILIAEE